MDFSLDDDQVALRDAVRRYCNDTYPAHERGNAETAAQSRERWQGLAQLGLLGAPFSEELGGSGHGTTELMLIAHEFGRVLGGRAFDSSVVLAGKLLEQHGDSAVRQQWIPALIAGEARFSVACHEAEGRYDLAHVEARATAASDGYVVHGRKVLVPEGESADVFLVTVRMANDARSDSGVSLLAIPATTPGVSVQGFSTLDGRRAAHVNFDQVQVGGEALVGAEGNGLDLLQEAIDRANAVACSEATGAIEALIDLTLEHVKTRHQFGAPLARFQVLQHRLADMLNFYENSRSVTCAAVLAVDEAEPQQRRRMVSAAKVFVGKAGRQVGHWAVQMHGGMGMTDECRVGHYVKRLMVIDQTFGNSAHHLKRFAGDPRVR